MSACSSSYSLLKVFFHAGHSQQRFTDMYPEKLDHRTIKTCITDRSKSDDCP